MNTATPRKVSGRRPLRLQLCLIDRKLFSHWSHQFPKVISAQADELTAAAHARHINNFRKDNIHGSQKN